jgi:membrane peptidoglycan carboxypeptidase
VPERGQQRRCVLPRRDALRGRHGAVGGGDVPANAHGYYGLAAASCGYFSVPPAALSWPQAAMLAGLVQAPTADDPLRSAANARAREMHVLGRLVATGTLTADQAGAYLRTPLRNLLAPAGDCVS